ncbi:hypothetical protein MVES1_003101 [Malassezia vespertilionis]|uniref:uncharacterized protein n=1 Tax=Malassezia vespertilionis TaxID=2020962 RepID=UPI0024B23C39|nr:uncharacterized protein MVES1_003101 [Malassezia vespertilionis]WFD07731.1 hypothetical protein MVES1_003101 [Malassezia vespertilionis]
MGFQDDNSPSVVVVVDTSTRSNAGTVKVETQTNTVRAKQTPPPPPPQSSSDSTPVGAVVGGVVGGVVGLALLLLLAWLLYRHIRNRKTTRALDTAYAVAGVGGGGVDRRARTRGNDTENPDMLWHNSFGSVPLVVPVGGADPEIDYAYRNSSQTSPPQSLPSDPKLSSRMWPHQPGPAAVEMQRMQSGGAYAQDSASHKTSVRSRQSELAAPMAEWSALAPAFTDVPAMGEPLETSEQADVHNESAPERAPVMIHAPSRQPSSVSVLQSPSSAYMWLPARDWQEEENVGRPEEQIPSGTQDAEEEQKLSSQLWRTNGALRVAN